MGIGVSCPMAAVATAVATAREVRGSQLGTPPVQSRVPQMRIDCALRQGDNGLWIVHLNVSCSELHWTLGCAVEMAGTPISRERWVHH
jgi:hypothetical protein